MYVKMTSQMEIREISQRLQAVRVQDITLVILCALSVYLFRSRELSILQPKWRKDFDPSIYKNGKFPGREERLPQPIITDLEGDGLNEILMVTNDLELEVLVLPHGTGADVLPHVQLRNVVKLPTAETDDGRQSYPVVMETGYLTSYGDSSEARKQVIVVIFDSWRILCFDSQLQLLWQQHLMDVGQVHEHHFVKSMGILITPSKISRIDNGTVIVGGSFAHKAHQHHGRYFEKTDGPDPQKQHALHQTQGPATGESGFTHFSTFALSGDTGLVRWHHLPGDFEPKSAETPSSKEPYHWKLSLKKGKLHLGEQHWARYSKGVRAQMPHVWNDLPDTRLDLADIRSDTPQPPGATDDPTAVVTDLFGPQGKHLIGYAYGGQRPHSRHEHVQNPNTLVIHNHDGIEMLALSSGRPFTHFRTQGEKAAFGDVNNDGVVERVRSKFRSGDCLADVSTIHPMTSEVFTGPLCEAPGWWESLSLSAAFYSDPSVSEDTPVAVSPVLVKSVAKKSGPFHHLMGRTLPSQRSGLDSIYVTSTGRLTSYGPNGEFNWQVRVPARWAEIAQMAQSYSVGNSDIVQMFNTAFKPSMTAFSPQIYGPKTALLVLGWESAAVVDLRDGHLMAEHSLPCQPTASPVLGDFNGDGATDFILTCPIGYIGFTLHSQHNYLYMVVVSTAVVLGVLLLAWCCRPDAEPND